MTVMLLIAASAAAIATLWIWLRDRASEREAPNRAKNQKESARLEGNEQRVPQSPIERERPSFSRDTTEHFQALGTFENPQLCGQNGEGELSSRTPDRTEHRTLPTPASPPGDARIVDEIKPGQGSGQSMSSSLNPEALITLSEPVGHSVVAERPIPLSRREPGPGEQDATSLDAVDEETDRSADDVLNRAGLPEDEVSERSNTAGDEDEDGAEGLKADPEGRAQDSPSVEPVAPSRSRGRRIDPEKRGGKPRVSSVSKGGQPERSRNTIGLKANETWRRRPELVCWFQGMARGWAVGAEVPEAFGSLSLQARQSPDSRLQEESSRSRCWRLQEPLGPVQLVGAGPEQEDCAAVEIPEAEFRIFKLTGDRAERGRAVREGSTGPFLVVVPESWQWSEELSGSYSRVIEFISPGSCRGYHVELPLAAGRALAFRTSDGEIVRIPCGGQRFGFVGLRVDDVSEHAAPLFVREPPHLHCSGSPDEVAVTTVVVGDEGPADGKPRWRDFSERFEDLRPAIANRRAGWFFVRLYDSSDELIESVDFRFVADLEAITVDSPSPFPGPSGHPPARVCFRHQPGCSVSSRSMSHLRIEPSSDETVAIVPPDPELDETQWMIAPARGRPVEVTVLIERVWWARTNGNGADARAWADQPLELSRDGFKATASTTVILRLPRAGWAEEVQVGFQASRSRPIHLSPSERECTIPLRELGGAHEIEEEGTASLKAWLTRSASDECSEVVIGSLPAQSSAAVEHSIFLRSFSGLAARSVMSVLSRIRPACRSPLRRLIRHLRTEIYDRIPKHQRGMPHERFVRDGLCVLALAVEQLGVCQPRGRWLSESWVRRARGAQEHFPEAMSAIRSWHRKLEHGLAIRDGFGGRTE